MRSVNGVSRQCNVQRSEAVLWIHGHLWRSGRIQLDAIRMLKQFLQHRSQFEASQRRTRANVDALSVEETQPGIPVQTYFVRLLEYPFVAIRRHPHEGDALAGRYVSTADLHIASGGAPTGDEGATDSEDLADCRGKQ